MENELLDWVDINDKVIWIKTKKEIYTKKLINRVCHIIIINKLWEIALQKRSKSVSFMPWAWSSSAWGHVASGLSYEEWALKELMEEIWVVWKIEFKDKFLYTNISNNHSKYVAFFELYYEWNFKYEDWEVEFVQWFNQDMIKEMIMKSEDFHPELLYILENYYF